MKFIKRFFLLGAVIVIGFLALIYYIGPFVNNVSLSDFGDQLFNYQLPEDTKLMEQRTICGRLSKEDKDFDFYASILIKSDKNLEEVKKHYSEINLKKVRSSGSPAQIEVLKVNKSVLESQYIKANKIVFKKLKGVEEFDNYYIVGIFNGGYNALFDLRN